MSTDIKDALKLLVVMLTVCLICIMGTIMQSNKTYKSKSVIIPDTLIITNNGISDTTFIYKRPY